MSRPVQDDPDVRHLSEFADLSEEATRAARRSRRTGHSQPRGAALLFRNGRIVAGAELEDTRAGTSGCAEQVALYRSLLERREPPRIVVVRGGAGGRGNGGPPCGACLQILLEFAPRARVYWGTLARPRGGQEVRQMIPGAFVARDLKGVRGS